MHTTGVNTENGSGESGSGGRASYGDPVRGVGLLLGIFAAMLFFAAPAFAQGDAEAKLRMVHLSPDAPDVTVTVDGEAIDALSDVSYLDATPYLPLPAGPHELAVYATGDDLENSEPVLEVTVEPEAGRAYTVAGVGLLADETFEAKLFTDSRKSPDEGDKAKVRVVHAVTDVGPATVSVEDGPELFALPGFANASNYRKVDAGTYTLDVTPAGAKSPAFSAPDAKLEDGGIYTAFAIGRASEGTLGTIITNDSKDGEIVARTGAAAEKSAEGARTEEAAEEAEAEEAALAEGNCPLRSR